MFKRAVALMLLICLFPLSPASADQATLFGVPILSTKAIREQFRSLPRVSPAELDVSLTFDGTALPMLKDEETYYLSITRESASSPQGILSANPSLTIAFFLNDLKTSIPEKMASGKALPLYIHSDDAYSVVYLLFTSLPILSLTTTTNSAFITRDEQRCSMILYAPAQEEKPLDVTNSLATIRLRGATSSTLAKKPYKLELHRTQYLDTRKISLLDMRKDDDWLLYPAHSDESKIRDAVAWRLWEIISNPTDGHAAGTLQSRYVEVLMNGEYFGLYLLMERFDEKTLDLDDDDALFKAISWDQPTAAQMRAQPAHATTLKGIEKKFPEPADKVDGNWDVFADYMELIFEKDGATFKAGIGDCTDVENMMDYWLFLQLSMASDNSWKNIYYAEIDGKIHAYPWDLDYSFGTGWTQGAPNMTHHYSDVTQTLLGFECGRRLIKYYPGAANYLKARWKELTVDSPLLTHEGIMQIAREYWDELHLSGAWVRNQKRWPSGNYVDDLDYFSDIVLTRFRYLNRYIRSLSDASVK